MESPPELSIPRVRRVRTGSEGSRRTQLPGTAGHLVVKEQVRGHGPGSCAAVRRLGLTMPLVPVRNPKQPRLQQPIVNLTQGS